MKTKLILSLFLSFFFIQAFGQKSNTTNEDEIFTIVEEMPQFKGGDKKMINYLNKKTRYPQKALEDKAKGVVYDRFIIYEDGSIQEVSVVRSVHPALDEEAIRVVKAMPKWKPGKQRGKKVKVQYNLPISFNIKE